MFHSRGEEVTGEQRNLFRLATLTYLKSILVGMKDRACLLDKPEILLGFEPSDLGAQLFVLARKAQLGKLLA